MKKISVVGLGKLGLCSALCFADKGFEVIGYDKDLNVINSLRDGVVQLKEPGLQDLFQRNRLNFTPTSLEGHVILNSDISFIIVPTPSNDDNRFSNSYIEDVLLTLSYHLKAKQKKHTFVIVSTVMPGSMRKFIDLVEKKSGEKHHEGFDIVYNPEFVAIGDVIKNFKNPDMLLFGIDKYRKEVEEIIEIYEQAVDNEPKFSIMNYEESEITKLSLNTFLTMKIAYANIVSDVCDSFNADVDKVTEAIGMDTRISPKLLKAGMSFGGTCFPRDVRALQELINSIGYDYNLPQTIGECNHLREKYIALKAIEGYPKCVNIVGVAYKDNTPVTEESPSLRVAELIENAGIKVKLFDQAVIREDVSNKIEDAVEDGATIILAYPNKKIAKTILSEATVLSKPNIKVIDPWRIFVKICPNYKNIKIIPIGGKTNW